jgi:hypothetical protein
MNRLEEKRLGSKESYNEREKNRFEMHENRNGAISAAVLWYIVSFGQDSTYRPLAGKSVRKNVMTPIRQ